MFDLRPSMLKDMMFRSMVVGVFGLLGLKNHSELR